MTVETKERETDKGKKEYYSQIHCTLCGSTLSCGVWKRDKAKATKSAIASYVQHSFKYHGLRK